jgi:hypothetical protein
MGNFSSVAKRFRDSIFFDTYRSVAFGDSCGRQVQPCPQWKVGSYLHRVRRQSRLNTPGYCFPADVMIHHIFLKHLYRSKAFRSINIRINLD